MTKMCYQIKSFNSDKTVHIKQSKRAYRGTDTMNKHILRPLFATSAENKKEDKKHTQYKAI